MISGHLRLANNQPPRDPARSRRWLRIGTEHLHISIPRSLRDALSVQVGHHLWWVDFLRSRRWRRQRSTLRIKDPGSRPNGHRGIANLRKQADVTQPTDLDDRQLAAVEAWLRDAGWWYPPDAVRAVHEGRDTYHPIDPRLTYEMARP